MISKTQRGEPLIASRRRYREALVNRLYCFGSRSPDRANWQILALYWPLRMSGRKSSVSADSSCAPMSQAGVVSPSPSWGRGRLSWS